MRKIKILVVALAVMTLLSACGAKNTSAEDGGSAGEANTPATKLAQAFKDIAADASKSTEDIAAELLSNEVIVFGPASMAVEPGYLNGFTEEIDGFTEGTTFGPMIGSIPFIGYVFQVEGDADSFIEKLESAADLRWNVCTEADECVTAKQGDKVFFVMAPLTFEE